MKNIQAAAYNGACMVINFLMFMIHNIIPVSIALDYYRYKDYYEDYFTGEDYNFTNPFPTPNPISYSSGGIWTLDFNSFEFW